MVVVQRDTCEGRVESRKWLIFTLAVATTSLLILVLLLFVDPLVLAAKYYLRIANGSVIHQLMSQKIEGPRLYINIFNITNSNEYLSGEDEKIKFDEVGPFVFQEYRYNNDLVIDAEPGIMKFTPTLWAEFIPEESIGDPQELKLVVPNIPMLSGVATASKYSFFIRNMFNMLVASLQSKPIVTTTVHEFLWGYNEPLLNFANNIIPGIIYYNSSGLLARLYDGGASYTLEFRTTEKEKFSVKSAKKFRVEKNETSGDYEEFFENTQNFTDAYEGAIFPTEISPDKKLNIFRHSVCKTFPFSRTGVTKTQYGSEAYTYDLANSTMDDRELCDSTGWCPSGLLNLSPCYLNFPFALSRGHFLHGDPKLLEKFEGLKPDAKKHSSEMIIDPKLGITVTSTISVQLSLFLIDLRFNSESRRFSDMALPVCHAILKHPSLPWQAETAFQVIYVYGPYILTISKLFCFILGLGLLGYSIRRFYCNWPYKNKKDFETCNSNKTAYVPLKLKKGFIF